jgi:glycosyltransferase involved in cell wall biosynthesis
MRVKNNRINPIQKYIFKKIADRYIAPAKFCIKLLVGIRTNETQIEKMSNGVDIEKFKPSKESKNENLLFVGRLHQNKGILTMLEALTYLKTSS